MLGWLPPEGLTISELAESVEMTTQGCGQFVRQLAAPGMVQVAVSLGCGGSGLGCGMSSSRAERELRAEIVIAAPIETVWSVLTDLSRMPEWSPELVRMVPLLPGGLRVGQQYVGINRRKLVVWPTRNVVAVLEPRRAMAWDTRSSGARWIYELSPAGEGTRLVLRRPVPRGVPVLARLFARLALGGVEQHADELEQGMARTLAGLSAAVPS